MTTTDDAPVLSAYGFCPHCGAKGKMRERRPDGNDTCEKGHVYPSRSAVYKNKHDARDIVLKQVDHAIDYAKEMGLSDDDYVEICPSRLSFWKALRAALQPKDSVMVPELEARIEAAKLRLLEAKAIHSHWSSMPGYEAEKYAQNKMAEIEQIIYSAICYLEGMGGPNRKALQLYEKAELDRLMYGTGVVRITTSET